MSRTGEMIRELEARENPTADERANLKVLTTNFDSMAASMLGIMENKDEDVGATSDEAKVLELIRKESETFSSGLKLTNTTKKVKAIKAAGGNRPVFHRLIGGIKLR